MSAIQLNPATVLYRFHKNVFAAYKSAAQR